MSPYIIQNGRYTYPELEEIFDKTDVLITPSVWYETFGYTVLEALSYGVPVIITDTVGAKDILVDGAGIIIDYNKKNDFLETLKRLGKTDLMLMNKIIVQEQHIMVLNEMCREICEKCYH